MKIHLLLLPLMVLISSLPSDAQNHSLPDIDSTFQEARNQAFAGDRESAIAKLESILERSPEYYDARLFLARVHLWNKSFTEARVCLETLLSGSPGSLEVIDAFTDLELWSERFEEAIGWADNGLAIDPRNEELIFRKALALHSLERNAEALSVLSPLLKKDPAPSKAADLLSRIESATLKYTVGVAYGVDVYQHSFDPAHYSSLQLQRLNTWGTMIARLNHASRFSITGLQAEVEAYPAISKSIYGNLVYGYSASALFPTHRVGAEVFGRLPHRLEGSGGMRYLLMRDGAVIRTYTASAGWYPGNNWLSLRSYVTPARTAGNSLSGSLTFRHYLDQPENYWGLSISGGFTPELRNMQSTLIPDESTVSLLASQRMGISYQRIFRRHLICNLTLDLSRQQMVYDTSKFNFLTGLNLVMKRKF